MFWTVMDSNQTLKTIGSKRIWQTQMFVYVEAVRALWFDDVFCIFSCPLNTIFKNMCDYIFRWSLESEMSDYIH